MPEILGSVFFLSENSVLTRHMCDSIIRLVLKRLYISNLSLLLILDWCYAIERIGIIDFNFSTYILCFDVLEAEIIVSIQD